MRILAPARDTAAGTVWLRTIGRREVVAPVGCIQVLPATQYVQEVETGRVAKSTASSREPASLAAALVRRGAIAACALCVFETAVAAAAAVESDGVAGGSRTSQENK